MVKPEQEKLGLDLHISVCSTERFKGGGLRGLPIMQGLPWTGLSRLGEVTPAFSSLAETRLSMRNRTMTWQCSCGQHLCRGSYGHTKEEIKQTFIPAGNEGQSWAQQEPISSYKTCAMGRSSPVSVKQKKIICGLAEQHLPEPL